MPEHTLLVMRGLDPRIHRTSQKQLLQTDGLPGMGERQRRRASDGYDRR
jgi:hypothetical protein